MNEGSPTLVNMTKHMEKGGIPHFFEVGKEGWASHVFVCSRSVEYFVRWAVCQTFKVHIQVMIRL